MSNQSAQESRIERDSMGEMAVPLNALYGPQTERARLNFPISRLRFSRAMIKALGCVKKCAAEVNHNLGLLDAERAKFIVAAAEQVIQGELDEQFVVDIFQTGSGTSSNMNANEVIANLANQLAKQSGADCKIHPNDHVNMGQSSNDVVPTAIHVAAGVEISALLIPKLKVLHASLFKKALEYTSLVKTGRTHLQDATPVTLGQEFSGYTRQIELGIQRIERSIVTLSELAQGGTAVGTGINTHPEFGARMAKQLSQLTGVTFIEAVNHFEAQGAKDAIVEMSGQLKTVASSLFKIANDIRWLASGPCCGLGEIALPAVQPGSSIMPGKVNPVIAESVIMVCAQVVGNDATITFANQAGSSFELNVMMPVMAHNLLESIELLASSAENFAKQCVDGIKPNNERLNELAEASIANCTALAPRLGYDLTASIAKEAFEKKSTVRQVTLDRGALTATELDELLDLVAMTKPGVR